MTAGKQRFLKMNLKGHQKNALKCIFFRKKDYFEKTLYHGYYAFEALNRRMPAVLVCGICGVSPDILFGEHNLIFTKPYQNQFNNLMTYRG